MIELLQQNAEWMCAIGMLVFAGVQVWQTKEQQKRDLCLKRLELAHGLDEIASTFTDDDDSAVKICNFLDSNASYFCAYLDKDGLDNYKKLSFYLLQLRQQKGASFPKTMEDVQTFFPLVYALDDSLIKTTKGLSIKGMKQ